MIAVGLYSLNVVFFPKNTFAYLTGEMNECERDGEYCQAMSVINHQAKPGDRVYLATYYRYWLRPDLLQCVNGTRNYIEGISSFSHEKRWLSLYQQGFLYLMADRSTHGAVLDDLKLESPPAWLKLNLLYEGGQLTVYRLDFDNPPTSQLRTCRQIHPPAWDVVEK
jgi:hypothetical protein